MKSVTSRRFRGFREAYANLPEGVRQQARRAYRLFLRDPSHPGLNLKKVDHENNVYSVRVGRGYRALGRLDAPTWFGSGSARTAITSYCRTAPAPPPAG
jgi:hypothetical protein